MMAQGRLQFLQPLDVRYLGEEIVFPTRSRWERL